MLPPPDNRTTVKNPRLGLQFAPFFALALSGCPDDTASTSDTETTGPGSPTDPGTGSDTEFVPTEGMDCTPPVIDLEDPAEAGEWSNVHDWSDIGPLLSCSTCDEGPGFLGTHAMHLPTGKILFWDGKKGMANLADQYLYSIEDDSFEYVPAVYDRTACAFDSRVSCLTSLDCEGYCTGVGENNANCAGTPDFTCETVMEPGDLFCSGHTHGVDGNVTIAGGNITGNAGAWGSTELLSFNSSSNTWNAFEDRLSAFRWYPSVIQLGDGRIMVHGGDLVTNSLEIFDPIAGTVIKTSNHPSDTNGIKTGFVQYPLIFQMPSGMVFYAGGEAFGGKLKNGYLFNLELFEWINLAFPSQVPGGSGVMYEPGKIMKSGGCDSGNARCLATDQTETISSSLNEIDLSWAPSCPMHHPRHFHTLTVLPDGKVLATGGNTQGNGVLNSFYCGDPDDLDSFVCNEANGDADCLVDRCSRTSAVETCVLGTDPCAPVGGNPVECMPAPGGECLQWNNTEKATKSAELWNPADGKWTELPSQDRERMYHSTAILLPDGRVLSAGGGKRNGLTDQENAEFYSPPYLFQGDRPVVSDVPEVVEYGVPFNVSISSPTAAEVDRVTFVRLGSVTHQFDMDQRFMELHFEVLSDEVISVLAPPTRFFAPPGYYMLFVLDEGVPSIGKYIRIE